MADHDLDAIEADACQCHEAYRSRGLVAPDCQHEDILALVAEVRRLRAALNNRDAAWEARLQQAYDDGDLNCDPWDIWPSEADRG